VSDIITCNDDNLGPKSEQHQWLLIKWNYIIKLSIPVK